MCMNCGCGQPNEDHGKPENITLQDLQPAGRANDQSLRESAQHNVVTAQLVTDEPSAREGLAQPAANSGAANAASQGGRGTPASES
jgi:hypothetical protein